MDDKDATVKRAVVALFRDPHYPSMEDGAVLTRLLAALDPWYPNELRQKPPHQPKHIYERSKP